jgi:hypothetical protein
MEYIAGRTIIRLTAFALIALTAGLAVSRADIFQPTAALPPPDGIYNLPLVCITPVCLVNANIAGFQTTSDILSAGNELVSTNAIFAALIFENNSGSPGAALGSLSIGGTIDFTYFGRSLTIPLGSFNAQITNFDFMGTFNGHPFEVRQNPLMASTGVTTINQVSPGGLYQISSFFDVFAELSLDNGPFVPGPPRHTTLSAVPEPASGGLAMVGVFGLLGMAWRGRGRIR